MTTLICWVGAVVGYGAIGALWWFPRFIRWQWNSYAASDLSPNDHLRMFAAWAFFFAVIWPIGLWSLWFATFDGRQRKKGQTRYDTWLRRFVQ